ncbi:MAG: HAMP domain-containing protein [Chloroflexi bacterium]|nr:HAMP domain-containing protein [Chloroflexota bacterium]
MQSSTREIRWRLLLLLLRAFVIVLFLSFLFFVGVTGYFLTSSSSTPVPLPFTNTLEGYYLANNSWDGVEAVFETMNVFDALNPILLDPEQRIILDRRTGSVSTVGSSYEFQHRDFVVELKTNDDLVGYLVITTYSLSARLGVARAILLPIGMISFILALFLVVVSILLVRRFVNPLADVIYAARSVANGKFDTRIPTEGPQDLRSLAESFNEMASSLERNDRERRDMLADIAHELRTPLSVIRGRLEGIIDGIYTADGGQVSLALEQTYLLERLVDDLRLLTLAETRQLHFEKKNVDLAQLIQHSIEMFSAEAREKNISLSLEKGSGDFSAELDPQRTEQVIGNLIGNALRYIPENGKIWVVLEETAESIRVSVNDNGPGVTEDELPYLFDRFWRKDKSRARSAGGTGLGLAIAKQLIEAQGGIIGARNLPEGGLQVQVNFKTR